MTTKSEIRIPQNWTEAETFGLIQLDAGRAYICDQDNLTLPPEHEFWGHNNQSAYLVFEDGSLWFVNNSGDEVWCDVDSFLTENPGVRDSEEEMDKALCGLAS